MNKDSQDDENVQIEQWRLERERLYEKLANCANAELDVQAILHAKESFTQTEDGHIPKPYAFPSDTYGVGLICCDLPMQLKQLAYYFATTIASVYTQGPVIYINTLESMHLTICHTSHPLEMKSDAQLLAEKHIHTLDTLCSKYGPFYIQPYKVVLSSSGAIILLYSAWKTLEGDEMDYTVDSIREEAKKTFENYPSTQTRSILHTTLARILVDPSDIQEQINNTHKICNKLTVQLQASTTRYCIQKILYIQETHQYSACGNTTSVTLGPRC